MADVTIKVKTSMVIDPSNGEQIEVMRITDFCRCVNKSNQQVHTLMYYGNKERVLHSIDIAGTKFIPLKEVFEFPFTVTGKNDSFYNCNPKIERTNA